MIYVGATETAILMLKIGAAVRDIPQIIVGVLIAKFVTVYG